MNLAHEIAMALRRTYWAMHRQADADLQPLDVTANQFVLLALLDAGDGVTQKELVRRASSDANTVGAMIANLEKKGLVAREPHPDDRRAWRVTLTAEGRRVYRRLWENSERFRDLLIEALGESDGRQLLSLLNKLFDNLNPSRS